MNNDLCIQQPYYVAYQAFPDNKDYYVLDSFRAPKGACNPDKIDTTLEDALARLPIPCLELELDSDLAEELGLIAKDECVSKATWNGKDLVVLSTSKVQDV